ncbi:MAG TPA: RNA-binding cell elongation regulator Jag/EloR [Acidimicrobiales bacterium]|nr:RNA-binding cell elongation regulator Jag/EloR [Acidimicrobiales bacterium]
MEWVETTGRTLEEAKETALDQLGVDEVDAEFEVLEEPRAGLFGRVRGEARVRARVRPTAPRPKEDRRDRRRRGRGAGDAVRSGGAAGVAVVGEDTVSSEETEEGGRSTESAGGRGQGRARAGNAGAQRSGNGRVPQDPGRGPAGRGDGVEDDDAEAAGKSGESGETGEMGEMGAAGQDADSGVTADASPAGRKRRRRGGRSRAAKVPGPDASVAREPSQSRQSQSDNGRGDMSVEVPLDEQGRVAEDFIKGLISEFGMEASVRVSTSGDEEVKLDLSGSELGLLIGPKGSTLLAVQDLTRTAVHHKTGAGNGRIFVDVGAYRQKRSDALARFAQQVADKVKETGSPTALEPMAAPDRKVVHDALTEVDGVSTISEGEEPRRRVVIVPSTPANA